MIIGSPDAMRAAGRAFAAQLQAGVMVALYGGLGAGKTLFCKGVLEGLGFTGEVPSPTFNIVHHYLPPDVALAIIHADLYRLNDPQELDEIGLDDGDAIRLIEWPEKGGVAMQDLDFKVRIAILNEIQRELVIEGRNEQ